MQIHHRWPREVGIKSKSAFSLVELSVSILILVILIVGILTGIHLINKANLSRAKMITANSEIPVIKGLTVWLESAMPESFQSETIEDGSIISNWYSRGNVSYKESNANSTGSQATDPVYVSNLAKGLPAVKFDSGHYLVAPDALVNTIGSVSHDGNYTLLFVESGRNISAGGSYFLALEGGDVNSDTIGYDSPTIINFFGHKADISSATSGTRIHLFSSSGTGASNQKSYYLNGQAQTQLTLNNLDSIKLADLKFTVDDNSSSGHNDALITKFLKQNLRNKLTKVSGPARWLMGNWTPTTDPSSVIYIREAANFNAPVTVEDATYINKTLSEKWLVSSEVPNPCKGSPCGSNGTCVANGASHSCTCNPGYSGGTCSTSVCTSNPCLHGGGCNVSGAGLAVCTCSGGYDVTTNCASCPSGTVEVNNACITDPCLTYTCNGHGACSTNSGSGLASCACSLGYTGAHCDQCDSAANYVSYNATCILNPCTTPGNPCLNGGTCNNQTSGASSYTCTCPAKYTGATCNTCATGYTGSAYPGCACNTAGGYVSYNSTCILNPCTTPGNPCLNGGTCNNQTSGASSYTCTCPAKYTGATCNTCATGYTGSAYPGCSCDTAGGYVSYNGTCILNPCTPSNPCQNGGTCNNQTSGASSYTCTCPAKFAGATCNTCATGYTGSAYPSCACDTAGGYAIFNGACVFDPCASNPCAPNGTCSSATGSVVCTCTAAYVSGGITCSTCVSGSWDGNYSYTINGIVYTGGCRPNPCASNPCLNGGACTPTGPSTYSCSCDDRHSGTTCNSCSAAYTGYPACYSCALGYKGTFANCYTDPCYTNNCSGHGTCMSDTYGNSQYCSCNAGYSGTSCEQQDPCLGNNCSGHGTCSNGICNCNAGYSGTSCEQDPCASNPCGGTSVGTTCSVNGGGVVCTCAPHSYGTYCNNCDAGYVWDSTFGGCKAVTIDPCASNPCGAGGTCSSATGSAVCTCTVAGYTGTYCNQCLPGYYWNGGTGCVPVADPCAGNNCSGHGTCSGGVCTCDGGYSGSSCATYDACYICRDRPDRGSCVNGACVCNPGWALPNCNQCAAGYIPDQNGGCSPDR